MFYTLILQEFLVQCQKEPQIPLGLHQEGQKTYGGTCCGNALRISEQQKVDFMQLLKLVRYLGNPIVGRVNLLEQLQSTSTSHDVAGKNN